VDVELACVDMEFGPAEHLEVRLERAVVSLGSRSKIPAHFEHLGPKNLFQVCSGFLGVHVGFVDVSHDGLHALQRGQRVA